MLPTLLLNALLAVTCLLAGLARAHDAPPAAQAGGFSAEAFQAARAAVIRETPQLLPIIRKGGAFNSEFSAVIANRMYSRTDAAAQADARAKLKVEAHGPRSWLLRLPFVNVVVFETDEGLVLVDSGYAPAGPALREALRSLSNRPLHTIIYTHHHADHAWGSWALLDMGPQGARPNIVATQAFVDQVRQDLRSHQYHQRANQQLSVPRALDDAVMPTQTVHGRHTLRIGGEDFVLIPARGETEDQLWVWAASRRIVASADYYQGFLPNAGNGWRRQRYVEDWAAALREMAALQPLRVLPGHGPALTTPQEVQEKLGTTAAALQTLADHALQGFNAGLRPDEIAHSAALPPALASQEHLRPDYVTAQDIARMVVRQYSGWYDGLPSRWNPAPLAAQARAIADLAGGPAQLIERAQALSGQDPAVAASLADWAWLAAPEDPVVLRGAYAVYQRRATAQSTSQEALTYLDHLTRLKLALQAQAARKP